MPKIKFDAIYRDLKNKIEAGEYPFHSLFPTEHELTATYGCIRSTIRRALSLLSEQGYIQSQQGKRVLVIYEPVVRNTFLIGGIESFKEAATRNKFKHYTRVVRFDKITADEDLSDKTGFPIGTKLYDVRRVRYLNDKPLILDKNLFLIAAVSDLDEEIAKQSIYEYLETKLKMKITTSKRRMTVEAATSEDKAWLELEDYNCLAVLSGRVFNSDGIQFEYTESRHHPNYFCFEDTATRNKKRFL